MIIHKTVTKSYNYHFDLTSEEAFTLYRAVEAAREYAETGDECDFMTSFMDKLHKQFNNPM